MEETARKVSRLVEEGWDGWDEETPGGMKGRPTSFLRLRLGRHFAYVPCGLSQARPLTVTDPNEFVPLICAELREVMATPADVKCTTCGELVEEELPWLLGAGTRAGMGATATVLKAEWRGVSVAGKVFKATVKNKLFNNELSVLSSLRPHPNVTRMLGWCAAPKVILLEFCENGSLFQLIHGERELGTRSVRETHRGTALVRRHGARIAIGLARALAHLHSYRFVHLDVSSRNVLLDADLEPKLCDFGMTLRLTGPGPGFCVKHIARTPSLWKAPELYALDPLYTAKVDVFAYAMIVWFVLSCFLLLFFSFPLSRTFTQENLSFPTLYIHTYNCTPTKIGRCSMQDNFHGTVI